MILCGEKELTRRVRSLRPPAGHSSSHRHFAYLHAQVILRNPIKFSSHFKIFLLDIKFFLVSLLLTFRPPLLCCSNHASFVLRSSFSSYLFVPCSFSSRVGDRAFSIIAHKLWSKLPLNICSSPCIFCLNVLYTYFYLLLFPI